MALIAQGLGVRAWHSRKMLSTFPGETKLLDTEDYAIGRDLIIINSRGNGRRSGSIAKIILNKGV